jgi:hypothetical protein
LVCALTCFHLYVLQEGLIIVDNKTSNIIEETKKIQIRRKPDSSSLHMQNPAADAFPPPSFTLNKAEAAQETQLKASRDVRCHTIIDQLGICFTKPFMGKLLILLLDKSLLTHAYIPSSGPLWILGMKNLGI